LIASATAAGSASSKTTTGGELHEAEKRERSLLGRLQDLDVPGRERRRELPDGHHEGVVPGSDSGHDPDRLAPEHRGIAPHVLAGRAAFKDARRAGEEADVVRGHGHLVPCVGQGLADVLGLEGRKLLRVLLDQVAGSALEPLRKRVLGRLDGAVRILGRAARDLRDHLARRRIDDLHRLSAGRVDPLPADEILVLRHRHAHLMNLRLHYYGTASVARGRFPNNPEASS
jgi:hypothetical protein